MNIPTGAYNQCVDCIYSLYHYDHLLSCLQTICIQHRIWCVVGSVNTSCLNKEKICRWCHAGALECQMLPLDSVWTCSGGAYGWLVEWFSIPFRVRCTLNQSQFRSQEEVVPNISRSSAPYAFSITLKIAPLQNPCVLKMKVLL